eukprot:SAG11_NODE_26591_length_343_cov_0.836066_1_plen_71_part_10
MVSRDICCKREGVLSYREIAEFTKVTFLNSSEIKAVELLFYFLRDTAGQWEEDFRQEYGRVANPRKVGKDG